MAFLFSSARRHLYALAHTADCISRARSVSTAGRPLPRPPPARRLLQPALSSTSPTPSGNSTRTPGPNRRLTDHNIPFTYVYVIDPTTNTRSPTAHPLTDLLAAARAHTPRRTLELVASHPEPIVRLTTRTELEARYRAVRRVEAAAARASGEPKEVQLSWGVAPGDVAHKLRKARRDLEKGYRVSVAVAMKRGQRPSSRQEVIAFADEIAEALAGAGEECQEREITQRLMVLTFRRVDVS